MTTKADFESAVNGLGQIPGPYQSAMRQLLMDAYRVATNSPDPRTQVGALIIQSPQTVSGGAVKACNRFPRGRQYTDDQAADSKWKGPNIVHAEQEAIYRAARDGFMTEQAWMVAPWAACTGCAKAIVQAGIETVVMHHEMMIKTPKKWRADILNAHEILQQGGVRLLAYRGRLWETPERGFDGILFDGVRWLP